MIKVRKLKLKVKTKVLLDDLSFDLERGKIYALLGDNGSGKTTLLRVLSSYYQKYEGSILIGERDLKTLKRKEKEAFHAILPQCTASIDMSVESLLSINKNGLKSLESLGLGNFRERRLLSLSGGEREMVYLAFLLSRSATLYLFDEVEANLDSKYKKVAEGIMKELKEQNKIVIASFHDINRALSIADEVIVLDKGRLIFKGGKEAFLKSNIAKTYFDLSLNILKDDEGNEIKILL